jgi:hypothetical protein
MKLRFHHIYSTSLIFTFTNFIPLVYLYELEYLRAAAYLSLISLQSFHCRFPEFYPFIIFLKILENKVSRKISKNPYKFLCPKWDREAPGRHQEGRPRHHMHRGRGPALVSWEFRDSSHRVAYRRGSMVVTMGPARDCANEDTSVYPGFGPSRVEVKPLLPACFVLC